jgi:hypothetical protein
MLKDSELTPCFIVGAGRSGTKFLRDLLSASSDVAIIPYDVGYVWRYGNEYFPSDEFSPDMANEKTIHYIRRVLPKLVSKESNKNAKILLEKSVPNTLRVAYLNAIYPDAKFIHLIRDGRAVVESSHRMWTSPPESGYLLKKLQYFPWSNYRYAMWYFSNMLKGRIRSERGQYIWGPRYRGIEDDLKSLSLEQVCARQWRRCVELSQDQMSGISPERVFEVRYEDFMLGQNTLELICHFIGISNIEPVLEAYKNKASPTHIDKWRSRAGTINFGVVMEEIGPLLEGLGYTD